MRIFLAGASGVIGQRLIPLLVAAGHDVIGMTRTPAHTEAIASQGGQPVICDVFNRPALIDAVVSSKATVVMHQLTDLPDDSSRIREFSASNNRIRREGTGNLLAAASIAGVERVVAQSIAWDPPGDGGLAKSDLESQVLAIDGVVLRYGQFYGPGTYYEEEPPDPPRIHVQAAAQRSLFALDSSSGIFVLAES